MTLPRPLSGVRILFAEDHPITRTLFSESLSHLGAEVIAVTNGALAISACRGAKEAGSPFDVVLLDYRMPLCDGAAAASVIGTDGFDGLVVGLTAGIDPDEVRRWRESGCAFVLPKGIGPREVARRLAAFAGNTGARADSAAG